MDKARQELPSRPEGLSSHLQVAFSGKEANSKHFQFWLRNNVHACETEDYVVLLDVDNDEYSALHGAQAAAVLSILRSQTQPSSQEFPDIDSVTSELMSLRLITASKGEGREWSNPGIPLPKLCLVETTLEHTLFDSESPTTTCVRAADIVNVVVAFGLSALRLRAGSLKAAISYAQNVRAGRLGRVGATTASAIRALTSYRRIRPFVFTAYDQCVLESLTLLTFLHRYGIHPSWVFGVRTEPFRAHCWLQLEDYVLNDTPDHAAAFTPILVV